MEIDREKNILILIMQHVCDLGTLQHWKAPEYNTFKWGGNVK